MIGLQNVKSATDDLGVDGTLLQAAIDKLKDFAATLNDVCVSGRENVDKLLGCMMAIDIIIGKEDGNG